MLPTVDESALPDLFDTVAAQTSLASARDGTVWPRGEVLAGR